MCLIKALKFGRLFYECFPCKIKSHYDEAKRLQNETMKKTYPEYEREFANAIVKKRKEKKRTEISFQRKDKKEEKLSTKV